jgi:hypothetical protein
VVRFGHAQTGQKQAAVMLYIILGLGLCYLAIRYGLARPANERAAMLSGGVGIVICILMIVFGLGLIAWGW